MSIYKIEEWSKEFGGKVYVAFVKCRGPCWGMRWGEIGRAGTREEAEAICRENLQPASGPWFYTADDLRAQS